MFNLKHERDLEPLADASPAKKSRAEDSEMAQTPQSDGSVPGYPELHAQYIPVAMSLSGTAFPSAPSFTSHTYVSDSVPRSTALNFQPSPSAFTSAFANGGSSGSDSSSGTESLAEAVQMSLAQRRPFSLETAAQSSTSDIFTPISSSFTSPSSAFPPPAKEEIVIKPSHHHPAVMHQHFGRGNYMEHAGGVGEDGEEQEAEAREERERQQQIVEEEEEEEEDQAGQDQEEEEDERQQEEEEEEDLQLTHEEENDVSTPLTHVTEYPSFYKSFSSSVPHSSTSSSPFAYSSGPSTPLSSIRVRGPPEPVAPWGGLDVPFVCLLLIVLSIFFPYYHDSKGSHTPMDVVCNTQLLGYYCPLPVVDSNITLLWKHTPLSYTLFNSTIHKEPEPFLWTFGAFTNRVPLIWILAGIVEVMFVEAFLTTRVFSVPSPWRAVPGFHFVGLSWLAYSVLTASRPCGYESLGLGFVLGLVGQAMFWMMHADFKSILMLGALSVAMTFLFNDFPTSAITVFILRLALCY